MTLAYTGVMTVTISNSFKGAYTNTADDTVLILDNPSSPPLLRVYSLTTGGFVKNINLTTSLQVTTLTLLGSGASALIAGQNSGTLDLVELSGGYKTTHTGGATPQTNNINYTNFSATDPGNGVSLFLTNQNKVLNKFTHSTQVQSQITVQNISLRTSPANGQLWSIIFKGSGRFFIGNQSGQIFEIDGTGQVYNTINLQGYKNPVTRVLPNLQTGWSVTGLVYDTGSGLLLAQSSDGNTYLVDPTTPGGSVLQTNRTGQGTHTYMSEPASGIVLGAKNEGTFITNNSVLELDFTVEPLQLRDILFINQSNAWFSCGINTVNSKWWAVNNNAGYKLYYGTITPRTTTTKTVTMPIASTEGELIILDDTAGVGGSYVLLSTYSSYTRDIRLPTGKNIIEITKQGEGVDAKWSASRYST